MPKAPLHPCSYPGCNNLVEAGRCDQHKVTADQTWQRDAERQGLYGRRWKRIRAAHLAVNPWCVRCLEDGEYIPATDVDHIVDHKGDVELFYKGDLQSLCHKHHSEKTVTENAPGGVKNYHLGDRTAHGASDAKKVPNVGNSELSGPQVRQPGEQLRKPGEQTRQTGNQMRRPGVDNPIGGRKVC